VKVGDLIKYTYDDSRKYGLILSIPPHLKKDIQHTQFMDMLLEIYWDTGEISLVFDHEVIAL
jgi:hypothetical protein